MSRTESTPSIRVYSSGASRRGSHPPLQPPSSALPMSIPNAREPAPPPLPPPRYISGLSLGQDSGWQWPNSRDGLEPGNGRIPFGTHPLGGGHTGKSAYDMCGPESRRSSQMSSVAADGDAQGTESMDYGGGDRSLTRPSLASFRLQSERNLGQKEVRNSATAYDKQLLSKIGGPTEHSQSPRNGFSKLAGRLTPLSMPDHRYPSLESPHRWPSAPSSAISPGAGYRSPLFDHHPIDSPFSSRHNSTAESNCFDETFPAQSHRSSVDQGIFLDPELGAEENGMRELNINERSPAASDDFQFGAQSKKRRASSPPREHARDDRPVGNDHDLYHRRSMQMLNRQGSVSAASTARYPAQPGSLSSQSSTGHRDSYASSWNLSVASSATSYGGGGERVSPGAGALSPALVDPAFGPVSPYAASRSVPRSPRSSLSKATPHQRRTSDADPAQNGAAASDSQAHSRQNSVARMQGFFVCECCPKKPKKFDTKEELDLHTMEKQYQCQYCPNRFKNKNEAERHQNSLHLRRHSWSCQALAGVHAAFHPSTMHPATADVCGYCGDEFPNPANWDARAEHVCQRHKFGECNQAKKFFRADHFRQHLKHSHAGTSGKWTNMLENACMREEAAPLPLSRDTQPQPFGVAPAPASHHQQGGMPAASTMPSVIDEVQNES